MFSFPDDYEEGWTLQNEIKKDGIGLHTGLKCTVIIKPTELTGFHISFSNEPSKVTLIDISQVRNTPLCTTFASPRTFPNLFLLMLINSQDINN